MRVVYLDNAVDAVDGACRQEVLTKPGGGMHCAAYAPTAAAQAVINHHDFTPDSCSDASPRFTVLYRPGHYDLLIG
jgi:hypothetical protein